jgi:hypothetical protein
MILPLGNWISTYIEHCILPCPKITSKWIRDFNVRPESLKLLDENTVETLQDLRHEQQLSE